jgi:hypothetical protein
MKRILTASLSAALLAIAFSAHAQVVPFDLEIGYRWLDLKGNEDMYRTQINEQNGVVIRNFSLATSDFNGDTTLMDRFRVDVSDLGAGPARSIRIEAARTGAYDLKIGYRSTDSFSALPAFANPFLAQGIIPGQQTYDRTRSMVDVDLELMPGRAIVPFVGFTWNDDHGPGTTTYTLGQDEFSLDQSLNERDREVRAGASFQWRTISGQFTEGLRNFRSDETLSLAPGAGAGNNVGTGNNFGTVLGQPVTATSISRIDSTHVKTPFTNFYITDQVMNRLRLIGNYVRFSADSASGETEADAGSFVSFPLSRFFNGINEHDSSAAKNKTWRGGGRAEVSLYPNVDFIAGYQKDHRELDGTALIDTTFLQTITFSGFDKRDVETILASSGSIDRDESVVNAAVSVRAVGPFALRGEYRESKQDFNVSPDLSEIVVPGAQGGDFTRRVHTFDVTGSYTQSGFMLGAAWRKDSANQPVFRTDFLDRDRIRLRGAWTSPKSFFRAGITAERTNQSDDRSDIGYDARMRQYSGDVELVPLTWLHLRGSLSQFRADSDISIRQPQDFSIIPSIQAENGKAHEGGLSLLHGPVSLDASLGRFENRGTTPFDIDRLRVRVTYDFGPKTGVAGEWDRDKYNEASPSFGDFEASRYGLYFRWHP